MEIHNCYLRRLRLLLAPRGARALMEIHNCYLRRGGCAPSFTCAACAGRESAGLGAVYFSLGTIKRAASSSAATTDWAASGGGTMSGSIGSAEGAARVI